MSDDPRIIRVKHLQDYCLELVFSDGTRGEMDFREWIVGRGGVFALLEDIAFFQQVQLEPTFGTIRWPNDVDFCPDVLYSKVTGKPIPFASPDEPEATARKRSA